MAEVSQVPSVFVFMAKSRFFGSPLKAGRSHCGRRVFGAAASVL